MSENTFRKKNELEVDLNSFSRDWLVASFFLLKLNKFNIVSDFVNISTDMYEI